MIEFKGECGHTVRAKDEDAGGSVRCSYCGRPTPVPQPQDEGAIDFLFSEVEHSEGSSTGAAPKARTRRRLFSKRRRGPDEFNPFALIAKLCWAALLISVIIFVGKEWVVPLFEEGRRALPNTRIADNQGQKKAQKGSGTRRGATGQGLIAGGLPSGLYVSSTPPRAAVYAIEMSKAPDSGRIYDVRGCTSFLANGACPDVPDGAYAVEVVFPWNDPTFGGYRGFIPFRRAIEYASDAERRKLVAEYFLPDEATSVFINETPDDIYIVRQYRNVEVRNGLSNGVRALFLPKLLSPDGVTFCISDLVTDYIPNTKSYAFNEKHVRDELNYYGVPKHDQEFVVEALLRIGAIPYITPDRRTRMFKIGIQDGRFRPKIIREASP